MKTKKRIRNVPTNIITGFLGAGKTTAILHLLKQKPANERWAVLVNEFGEIGVDGSLFQGQVNQKQSVFIKEVPGGCMCCVSGGLPMQVAINYLLSHVKPDRLLIEPTGAGHPLRSLTILSGDQYRNVISLQTIVVMVDARKLTETRYTAHDSFNQQIGMADILIGNKQDLYKAQDHANLEKYAKEKGAPEVRVMYTINGEFSIDLLKGKTKSLPQTSHRKTISETTEPLVPAPLPETGYLKATNKGAGYQSIGWRFSANKLFDRQKLLTFFNDLKVERMKAVFITVNGIFGYNFTDDCLTETELDEANESSIEFIATNILSSWEEDLFACLA